MPKKHILFVMESLRIGGAEKSLLTILSMFDYDKYEVDLMLFRHNGEFMSFIPKEVNLLSEDRIFQCFDRNRKISPLVYAKQGNLKNAVHSAVYLVEAALAKIVHKPLYIGWQHQKHFFESQTRHYDAAIAFLERRTIYYVADLISADKKIAFIHNDYTVYPYDKEEDMRCFDKFNSIATVSEHCRDVLCEKFPMYSEKFTVIKNMVSEKLINSLAEEEIPNFYKDDDTLYLSSVGRLTFQKGFDLAIEICARLVEEGYKVKWYIVGEGEQRESLERKIAKMKLENNIILAGADVNPYRWMKMCDVYVQPSRFEGFGITIAEAKALNKKIVASDIPEFREQLIDYANAAFAVGVLDFASKIIEKTEQKIYMHNVKKQIEIEKLYSIIENNIV